MVRVFLLFLLLNDLVFAQQNLVIGLSTPRADLSSIAIGNLVYFIGGTNTNGGLSNVVDIYDYSVQFFYKAVTLVSSRKNVATELVNGSLWLCGSGSVTCDIFWDPSNLTTARSTINMPVTRSQLGITTLNELVFVSGSDTPPHRLDVYNNVNKTWNAPLNLTNSFNYMPSILSTNNIVMIAGGFDTDRSIVSQGIDVYNYTSSSWSAMNLSIGRFGMLSTELKSFNWMFFAGGNSNSGFVSRIDIFDTRNGTWLPLRQLSAPSAFGSATQWGTVVSFLSGKFVDFYDASIDRWWTVSVTPRERSTIVGAGNYVFIAGGVFNDTVVTDDAIFISLPDQIATVSTSDFPETSESTSQLPVIPAPESDDNKYILSGVVPVAATVVFALIVAAIIIAILFKRRKTKVNGNGPNIELKPADYVEMPSRMNSVRVSTEVNRKSILLLGGSPLMIQYEIGKGSAGTVFKATWREMTVAVKRLNEEHDLPEARAILEKECELMSSMIPHQNVVRFYGTISNPNLCIVTEFCQHGSLLSYLFSKTAIDMRKRVAILQQVAEGMAHLASQRIVHRDLAARNCLLKEGFDTVVSDFGMSRFTADKNYVAATGVQFGWPIKWMAPETFETKKFSENTDVFSFGVLCIEVLTRQPPYPEYSTEDFVLYVLSRDLISTLPNYIPPNTPEFLHQLIRSCISQDPKYRPDFEEVARIFRTELNQ
eukprot:TRINITY_DN430_c0_g1_i1.p1 TRINITY_DN430_c0_g1~~TRINITY_DN430_c0_g1_i1.p1  ORF type:complete len:709 (+),score=161.88 TRINITY_DN430_c0_g1_i1:49-2175(+)